MGNNLSINQNDMRINDTILGKEVKKVLKNVQQVSSYEEDIPVTIPINKYRACCLGVAKTEPQDNDFITVKLPTISEDSNNPLGYVVDYQDLGLQFKLLNNDKNFCTDLELTTSESGQCDKIMVNNCAKSLYDIGCIKTIERTSDSGQKTIIPVWNSENKKCFEVDGSLSYGPEECMCVNSFTGFTLNTKPSASITSPNYSKRVNPYNINGSDQNSYTKYSANLFKYDSQYQRPQVLDKRCASGIIGGSKASGKGPTYTGAKLGYDVDVDICLSQINIGDSQIGEANFENINLTNVCGGGVNYEKNEKPPQSKPSDVANDDLDDDSEEQKNKNEDQNNETEEQENENQEQKNETEKSKNENNETQQTIDELKALINSIKGSQEINKKEDLKRELIKSKNEDKNIDSNEDINDEFDEKENSSVLLILILIIVILIGGYFIHLRLKK